MTFSFGPYSVTPPHHKLTIHRVGPKRKSHQIHSKKDKKAKSHSKKKKSKHHHIGKTLVNTLQEMNDTKESEEEAQEDIFREEENEDK